MNKIDRKLYEAPSDHYDIRIALILFVFLSVCVNAILWAEGDSRTFSNKQTCQQLDISKSHLVYVDCDVIITAPVENGRSPNMAVFFFEPISINQASYELLQTVRGVGPKLAQQIITYRSEVGRFVSLESIKKLTRVGEKRAQYLATQFSFN